MTKLPDSRYFIPHLIIQIAGYIDNNKEKTVIGSLQDFMQFNYSHLCNLSGKCLPGSEESHRFNYRELPFRQGKGQEYFQLGTKTY